MIFDDIKTNWRRRVLQLNSLDSAHVNTNNLTYRFSVEHIPLNEFGIYDFETKIFQFEYKLYSI